MKEGHKTYIICTSPKGNAVSNYFIMMALALQKAGHTVVIVMDKQHTRQEHYEGISLYSWPSKRPTTYKDFQFFYGLCKRYKPDVTIGQFGSTNVVLLISYLLGIQNRWVYWHTMFAQLNTDFRHTEKQKNFLYSRKKWLLKLFATHIFTNSNATKEDLSNVFNIKEASITVLHYLIPDYFEGKSIQKQEEREFAVAFVGRMDRSKGHIEVIQDIPSVLKVYPSLKFYFIGDGSERAKLEAMSQNLNIENNVIFTGNLPLEKVYNLLSSVLIHISASKEEAFGLVNVEALSAGTPIMAKGVGGIKDILVHKKNGYFYNPKEPMSLLTTMTAIINHPWIELSETARADFIHKYKCHDKNIQEQLDTFEQILSVSKGKAQLT